MRSLAAGLIGALALAIAAVVVSPSSAQLPGTPSLPDLPGTPDDPDAGPEGEPPADDPQSPATPPAQAGPSKLDPFPVVVVAGRQGRRATRVTELSVRGPRKARVVVRCLGARCQMRRTVATIPRAKRLRVKKAQRLYRVGLTIEVRVTGKDRVGKYTKIRFRRSRTPARSDACLQPDSSRPGECP